MQTIVKLGDYNVRAFGVDGEPVPWLALVDICHHLDFADAGVVAAKQISLEDQRTIIIQKSGPGTNRLIVVEPTAAFRLICRGRSTKAVDLANVFFSRLRKGLFFDPQPSPNIDLAKRLVQHIIDTHPAGERPMINDSVRICGHVLRLVEKPHDHILHFNCADVFDLLGFNAKPKPLVRFAEAKQLVRDIEADSRKIENQTLSPHDLAVLIAGTHCNKRWSIFNHFGVDVGTTPQAIVRALMPLVTFSRPKLDTLPAVAGVLGQISLPVP